MLNRAKRKYQAGMKRCITLIHRIEGSYEDKIDFESKTADELIEMADKLK